jgi:hypothetical protein
MSAGKKAILASAAFWLISAQLITASIYQGQEEQRNRALILKNAGACCERLSKAALDYVCLEEILEKVDNSRDVTTTSTRPSRFGPGWPSAQAPGYSGRGFEERKFLYDYQYIRTGDLRKEKRNLLEMDGSKLKVKIEDSPLLTDMFYYQNVLFGPVNLLEEQKQPFYDYELTGDDTIVGEKAVVLKITPRLPPASLSGKAWLRERDSAVLKIEWHEKSIEKFAILEETARKYKSEPQITMTTEFGFEKNGLRFPSRHYIEEAYINKKGKKFVRSRTTVSYRDYKFFTVETQVQVR